MVVDNDIGWTSGPWGTAAPWTTWSGCQASTAGSSVVTTTVTTSGSTQALTTTDYDVQVKAASATSDADSAESTSDSDSDSADTSDSGAKPTGFAFAGSAAGVVGVVAGAILL